MRRENNEKGCGREREIKTEKLKGLWQKEGENKGVEGGRGNKERDIRKKGKSKNERIRSKRECEIKIYDKSKREDNGKEGKKPSDKRMGWEGRVR